MDKLTDYVRWMADFPIAATGLRDADALVFCALSYFDWSTAFEDSPEPKQMRDLKNMLENADGKVKITGSVDGYPRLLKACIESRRYGELTLSNYVDIMRKDPPMQFSAVCFSDDSYFSFLAYRGTDNSLTGWKEDFMISFTRTDAQIEALRYAQTHITTGRKWYIGGHSKGGYLALYVGCTLDEAQLKTVERVYMLDGPGFCPDVLDAGLVRRVNDHTTRIIPGYSVVGKLFEPEITDTHIVRSDEKGFLQHNLISWTIDHGKPAELDVCDSESEQIHQAIDEWISGMNIEERTAFINELFDALGAGGAERVSEITKGGASGAFMILRRLLDSGKIMREALTDFIRYLMHAKFDSLHHKHEDEQSDSETGSDDASQNLKEGES